MHHVLLSALGLFADKCYCLKNNLNNNKMQHNFFSENKFFLLHSFLYIYEKADCSNSGLFKFNSTKKIKVKYTLCPLQQMVAKLHMITLCSQEPSSAYLFILKKKKNMTQYPCFTVWNRIRVGAVFYGLTLPWG